MDFSLVFATRDRINLLRGLLTSLSINTHNKQNVEIIAVYDDDDAATHNAVYSTLKNFSDLNIRFIKRIRSNFLNRDYINLAAEQSTGRYIHILNDDIEYLTYHWDKIAMESLDEYTSNNKIVYGMVDDSMEFVRAHQNLQYTGFPIISRESFNVLGYAMHPTFPSWSADIHLYRIYKSVGRVLDMRQIKLLHLNHHTNMRPKDETSRHVAAIDIDIDIRLLGIEYDVEKLAQAAGVAPNWSEAFPANYSPDGRPVHEIMGRRNPININYERRMDALRRRG